ncbi:MAG: type II toxin-antitoxin system VapC family toxin [Candidatus Limnocylindria bacterium]
MKSGSDLLYLDSSALVKLVSEELETKALRAFAEAWPHHVSSSLSRLEVLRTVRRRIAVARRGAADRTAAEAMLDRAEAMFARISLTPIDAAVLDRAARLDPPFLRALDAIHLATALSLAGVANFVAYDARLADAARLAGLAAFTPV